METITIKEKSLIDKIEIVDHHEVEASWNLLPLKNRPIHFPKNFLSEIDEESDFFIIYLSGTPIRKMKKIKKDIALNIQELDVREWDRYSQSGYHLIKLGPLENVVPNQREIIMPSEWRRANIREALEIAFFLQKRGIYLDSWHACYGQTNKWGEKKFNLLKSSPRKITAISRDIISDHYHLRPLLIYE